MPQTLSPWDILTSSDQFPEREKSNECTTQVRVAAADLAERVSKLCDSLGHVPSVSSGFRTNAANKATGGSTHSAHLSGEAVDLHDKDGKLGTALVRNPHLLEQFDLYMENPNYTKTWVHLSTRRPASGARIFIP